MHSIVKVTIASLLFVIYCPDISRAQFIPGKYEFGINAGTLIYQGGLSESYLGYFRNLQPAVGINASESLDDYFSFRASITRGEIGADESTYSSPAWRRERNLKFRSSITEFSGQLVWDLFGKTYSLGFHRFSPYFFVGAGLTILNIKRDWSRFNKNYFNSKSSASIGLGIDTLHKLPGVVPVLPVGAGLRYLVSNHIYINAEATYRLTASGYIDGFKYAADPSKNDHYYGVSLGVSYRIGRSGTSCPKVTL